MPVAADWTFESSVVGSGFLRPFIRQAPQGDRDPWMLKAVLRRGVDVTDEPVDFTAGIDDLEVVLTTYVSGTVTDAKAGSFAVQRWCCLSTMATSGGRRADSCA